MGFKKYHYPRCEHVEYIRSHGLDWMGTNACPKCRGNMHLHLEDTKEYTEKEVADL